MLCPYDCKVNRKFKGAHLKVAATESKAGPGSSSGFFCARRCEQFCYESFDRGVVIAGDEVPIPIYVGEAHAGGLGRELFAEFFGLASGQQGERFEDDAMFGILPAVRAEFR
jgi:hypothetical protein